MTERGVIYMAWGENAISQAKQSIESLRELVPEMPVMVVGDKAACGCFVDQYKISTHQCAVDPFDKGRKKGLRFLAGRIKPLLYDISPWEWTLYVDADTFFQQTPDIGFDLLKRWDIALAETKSRAFMDGIAGKEECEATGKEFGTGLLLYHNSGMIFFRKSVETKALFELWAKEWLRYEGWDEQVALKRALLRSEVKFLTLPYTWNHSGVKESYLVTHWYGAGDARFDMHERARNIQRYPQTPIDPMIRIEVSPGRYVKCREGEEKKVMAMYGINKLGSSQERNMETMSDNGPMVKVFKAPGQYVKMRRSDAEKLGLKYIPERSNKMIAPQQNKAELEPEPVPEAQHEDFTEIQGVGKATDEALHDHGIHTFEDLLNADLDFLSGRAKSAVEEWKADLG